MKMRSIIIVAMMVLLLSACTVSAPRPAPSPPVRTELEVTEEQILASDSSGHFINMWVGSSAAVITGGHSQTLSAVPFTDGESVYIPLADAAAVFGGTVIPEPGGGFTVAYDETLQDTRYQKNITIYPGKCRAKDNISGEQIEIASMGSLAAPVLKDSIVFVPDFYFDFFLTQTYAQHDLRTGLITVSNFDDGRMLAGFTLEDDFSMLGTAVKNRFSPTGKSEMLVDGELYETAYSDGTIELGVRTGSGLPDGMQTMIHSITLLTDAYATPRGLRVGDPVDRCYELYGSRPNDLGQVVAGVLNITEQDGVITGITRLAGGS